MTELPFFAGEEGRGHVLVLLFFVSVFVITVWGTWDGALPAGSEASLAETAREIAAGGGPLPMRFDGAPAHDTPPLAPWLMSLFFLLFGANDFTARFGFVLLSVAASWVLLVAGREASRDLAAHEAAAAEAREREHETRWATLPAATGVLAAIVLAATPLFGRFAPHVTTGLPLAFFASLALLGWLYLPERRFGAVLWGAAIAGGVLSAGAGGLLPVAGAAVAGAVERGRRRIWNMPAFLAATAAGAAIGGLWLVPAAARGGGFFESPLWTPLSSLVRPGPRAGAAIVDSFVNVWLRSFPWSIPATVAAARLLFSGGARRRACAVGEIDSALLLFAAAVFLPFALAGAEPVSSFLAVAPFTAILAAREIARWALLRGRHPMRRVWVVNHVLTALFCLLMLLVVSTFVSLRRSSADPIREVARVAGRISPAGARIGGYGPSVRGENARMLFYGGRSLEEPIETPAALAAALRADPAKLFLSSVNDVEALAGCGDFQMELRVYFGAGDLVLFGARQPRPDEAP
ncbi:MAG: hypothetical protein C4574_02350 [Candidatus Latescibacterota bacterium]|nr:MAG: hypothetical protein C4574_02350 [Candidatus Latescibacterota bacterium]